MKWCVLALLLCLSTATISMAQGQPTPLPSAPGGQIAAPKPGTEVVVGTVTDASDNTVSGATVVLEGPGPGNRRTVVTKGNGFFEFSGLEPGVTYHVTINAKGFANWTSPPIVLQPNQYLALKGSQLQVAHPTTTLTVVPSAPSTAEAQVKQQEQQRILKIIPNFYVSFNPNAAPLTPKLKFKLALRTSIDPVTILGIGAIAGFYQATDYPDYEQGAAGYGKRFGTVAADGFADIMIGGAILPSLLHQDPRYFYQGTGTKKSRALHAMSYAFVCRGDNGRPQPNYSTWGGDLATAALSNAYYPDANRGVGQVFTNFLIGTGERVMASLLQEFVFGKLTSRGNKINKAAADPDGK